MVAAQQIVFVDARPRQTHESYSIPGSISLPFNSSAEELAAFRNRYPADSHLVIYCSSATCLASQMLAEKLSQSGFQRIHIMEEGYFGWLRAEYGQDKVILSPSGKFSPETSSEKTDTPPHLATPQAAVDTTKASKSGPSGDPSRAELTPAPISWVEVKPLLNAGKVILVDVRAKSSYAAGHIPGAINLPELRFAQEIADFQKKYSKSSDLVLYCSSAPCSTSKVVAEKLVKEYGYNSVRYMTGGYQEWQQWELQTPPTKQ